MGIDAEILIRNVPYSLVTNEWLKETSWRICECIGAKHFFVDQEEGHLAIERTLSRYREDNDPAPGSEYHQDGEPIYAKDGECLLELNLCGRYYGVGYERGDLLLYCGIAEWLEANIPGCEVWYGGDSSGVCAEPFGKDAREALRRHLFSIEGRDYFRDRSSFMKSDDIVRPLPCMLCPGGTYRGERCGWGQGYAKYSCAGCGVATSTHDGGATWTIDKKE